MREIPWQSLGGAETSHEVTSWATDDGSYAITMTRPARVFSNPALNYRYTVWKRQGVTWEPLAGSDSELTVRAWLIEFKHPAFTREGSDA